MKRGVGMLVGCLCLLLCPAVPCSAKQWRGIVPLRSTRADVIKLLGEPKRLQWVYRDYFILDAEVVTFTWVDPTCVRKYPVEPDSEVRPGDLVLGISVRPKTPLPYDAFHVDERALTSPTQGFFSVSCIGHDGCIFTDGEEGFGYSTSKEGVTSHSYWAAAGEREAWMQEHSACKSAN